LTVREAFAEQHFLFRASILLNAWDFFGQTSGFSLTRSGPADHCCLHLDIA
jgi:hypothetical protein